MKTTDPSKTSKSLSYEVSGPPIEPSPSQGNEEWVGRSEEQSLDKVRDILFGAQSREFEQRFKALERRLWEENTALREEVSKSFSKLTAQIHEEIGNVTAQIQEEQHKRQATVNQVNKVIEELQGKLEAQLTDLHSQATQQYSLIEVNLNQQKQELTGHYEQTLARLQEQVDQGFKGLQADKTDRAVLAEMLMDVALRLKVGQRDVETS